MRGLSRPQSCRCHHFEGPLNISGIYVKAWPADLPSVQQRLEKVSGVEVHMTTEDGGLVVTVETDDVGTMADTVTNMQHMEGVLSATLVYHHDEQELHPLAATPFTPTGGVQ